MPATTLQLMWTALPRGIDTATSPAQARVSVLMTPRVTLADPTAPATLVNMPDLVDWPATLAGLRFAVTVDAGSGAPASLPATVVSAAADSSLWRALLPAATAVENRVFDQDRLSANPVMTYNGSRVLAGLRAGYAGTYRSSPVALPGHPEIFQTFSALLQSSGPSTPLLSAAEVGELDESALRSRHAALAADLIAHAHAGTLPAAVRHAGVVAAELARRTGRPPKQLFPSTGTEAEEFGRLLAFHTVARASEPTDSDPPTGFDAELHSVVTMLHDHPAVMSPLGLLVDLVVAAESLPNTAAITTAQPRLQVTVTVKRWRRTSGYDDPLQPVDGVRRRRRRWFRRLSSSCPSQRAGVGRRPAQPRRAWHLHPRPG
jgi:hypothetical protein